MVGIRCLSDFKSVEILGYAPRLLLNVGTAPIY